MLQPQEIIPQFKQAMSEIYGPRLERVVLYGSYARGDFHDESDLDFMVVLKDAKVSASSEIKRVSDVLWSLWEKSHTTIHFLPITSNKFHTGQTPLLYWIRKEGRDI